MAHSLLSSDSYSTFTNLDEPLPPYIHTPYVQPVYAHTPYVHTAYVHTPYSHVDCVYTDSTSPDTQVFNVSGFPSPLGPLHNADPASYSAILKVFCKLLSNSLLARRIQKAKKGAEEVQRVISDKVRLREEAERVRKVQNIIKSDRIMDQNLRLLGL